MQNSRTSKASYVSKARKVTMKYKILNGDCRKKLEKKTQNWKTQEKNSQLKKKISSQKLKNSALFRPLVHAEKMAKKPACSTCHFCRGLFAWMKICTYCILFISLTLGLFLSRRASFSTIDELNVSNPVRTPMHKSAEVARTRSFAMRISKLVVIIVSNPLYTTCGSVKVLSRVKKKIFRRQTQE